MAEEDFDFGMDMDDPDVTGDPMEALARLQAENEKLRAQLSQLGGGMPADDEAPPAPKDHPAAKNPEAYNFVRESLGAIMQEQQLTARKYEDAKAKLSAEYAPQYLGRALTEDEERTVSEVLALISPEDIDRVLQDQAQVKRMLVLTKYMTQAAREFEEPAPAVGSSDDAQILGKAEPTIPKEKQEAWQVAKAINPNLTPEQFLKYSEAS